MSIGNTKTYGNKGNNFPFQLAVLKGLALSQGKNLLEEVLTNSTIIGLESDINHLFDLNPNLYLVSKSVVYDSATPAFVAFITLAEL
jgi:hypothetical protein